MTYFFTSMQLKIKEEAGCSQKKNMKSAIMKYNWVHLISSTTFKYNFVLHVLFCCFKPPLFYIYYANTISIPH